MSQLAVEAAAIGVIFSLLLCVAVFAMTRDTRRIDAQPTASLPTAVPTAVPAAAPTDSPTTSLSVSADSQVSNPTA